MSGRALTGAVDTELGQVTTAPRWLVKIEFDSGDVRLWNGLGNLTAGTFSGAELVTNGTFDTDKAGWTDNDVGVGTWASGRLRLERTGTGSTQGKDLQRQTITMISGRTYRCSVVFRWLSSDSNSDLTYSSIGIDGVEQATSDTLLNLGEDVDHLLAFDFVATSSSHIFNFGTRGWSGGIVHYDNISIKEDEIYTGAGRLAQIEPIQETQEVIASGVQMSLTIIPTSDQPDAVDAILNIALGEEYQGRLVTIWQAQIDHTDGTLIDDPFIRFKGRLDVMEESELPGSTTINMMAENRLIDLERPRRRTYTPEDQKASHTGDTFFDEVAALQNREITL